jgi:phosphomevalonate kinase
MSEASAPGKLVIVGEYAVLYGAPAIAIAVEARAVAKVERLDGTLSELCGEAESERWPFTWNEVGAPVWSADPPEGRGRLLESLLSTLRERGTLVAPLPAIAVRLDSSGFFRGKGEKRGKLGLGSSAAVTVALTGAMLNAFAPKLLSLRGAVEIALEAHRRLQGGAGSGVDIAAAAAGGVVSLSRDPEGGIFWQELVFPQGLNWIALWTGQSASTTEMVGKFAQFRETQQPLFGAHFDDLCAISQAALGAWDRADVANLLCALAEYDAALRRLDRDAGIGIYSPAHHRLAELSRRNGAVYKPSGAGGGDFGVALADSPHVIGRIRELALRENILTIDGTAGARGLDAS